jgi:DNA-binding FadR family transcriptional regulator
VSRPVDVESFAPVRPLSAVEAVVEAIADTIRTGVAAVGDRLPPERLLAERLEVSRPTLREAIRVLVRAGILEVKPGPGGGNFVVSDVVPPTVGSRPPALRLADVSRVLEARRLLEPRVAQLAAIHADEDDYALLQRSIEQLWDTRDDLNRFIVFDHRFHLGVARATHNPTIVELVRVLLLHLVAIQQLAVERPYDPRWAVDMHERTLRAIMRRDPDEVDAAMDDHLGFLERVWETETGRGRLHRLPDFLIRREGDVDQPSPTDTGPADLP